MVTSSPRILLLSFYYSPDLSAGSFRATALVRAIRAQAPDACIDVITTLPNRYRSFSADAPELERDGALTVHRIRLPSHSSGMRDQAMAFVAFARAASVRVRDRSYDLVFATSGRLMSAALAARLARMLRAPLYLDLRDIFVDTIGDVLPAPLQMPVKAVFGRVEAWTVRRAAHVNLVSEGFRPYFESRYPEQSFSYFTNGIDEEFLTLASPEHIPDKGDRAAPIRVVYAGNMGEGQGLHAIVPELARRLAGRATFRLIGDGGRRTELERALVAAGVQNVEIVAPVSRAELIAEYRRATVLFLHLNDYPAFEKVLPSKIFEYAALGKPIWAGVAGYAAQFTRAEVSNAAVFAPCDASAAMRALDTLTLRDSLRAEFVRKFTRERIMSEMAADVLRFAGRPTAAAGGA